jgi:hypothetical protein
MPPKGRTKAHISSFFHSHVIQPKSIYSRYKKVSKPLRAPAERVRSQRNEFCRGYDYNREYAIGLPDTPAPQKHKGAAPNAESKTLEAQGDSWVHLGKGYHLPKEFIG